MQGNETEGAKEAKLIYFLMDYMSLVSCEHCNDGCIRCDDKGFQKAFSC